MESRGVVMGHNPKFKPQARGQGGKKGPESDTPKPPKPHKEAPAQPPGAWAGRVPAARAAARGGVARRAAHGESRLLLLLGLKRLGTIKATEALQGLRDDPDLGDNAAKQLRGRT